MNRSLIVLSIFFFAAVLIIPQTGLGQGSPNPPACGAGRTCIDNPLGTTSTVQDLIKKIITWLTEIGGIIAVGMIIWGGLQIAVAGGNEERLSKGKKTILYTVIGYGIILIGWGIETIIRDIFS